jgi:hypothetical protein
LDEEHSLASGIFWILFFAVEKEYLARKDSRQKPSRTMARSVLLILDFRFQISDFRFQISDLQKN